MYTTLTESQIESTVARKLVHLDKQYLSGKLSTAQYDHEVMILDKWATQQYKAIS